MGRPSGQNAREEQARRLRGEPASRTRGERGPMGPHHEEAGEARAWAGLRGRREATAAGRPAAVTGPGTPESPKRGGATITPEFQNHLSAERMERSKADRETLPRGRPRPQRGPAHPHRCPRGIVGTGSDALPAQDACVPGLTNAPGEWPVPSLRRAATAERSSRLFPSPPVATDDRSSHTQDNRSRDCGPRDESRARQRGRGGELPYRSRRQRQG
ncbi:uncharacterized protein LOC123823350 [Phyllostomus hastatus]|uniref:uncharacterized protein LOC123823350 n=1 Tax=Phyllostomus hastatus TaxID=9423 RepID=UPI001E6804E0|nr:uncharacterized protein LOC123823350 [Phyllostomus hastatus]